MAGFSDLPKLNDEEQGFDSLPEAGKYKKPAPVKVEQKPKKVKTPAPVKVEQKPKEFTRIDTIKKTGIMTPDEYRRQKAFYEGRPLTQEPARISNIPSLPLPRISQVGTIFDTLQEEKTIPILKGTAWEYDSKPAPKSEKPYIPPGVPRIGTKKQRAIGNRIKNWAVRAIDKTQDFINQTTSIATDPLVMAADKAMELSRPEEGSRAAQLDEKIAPMLIGKEIYDNMRKDKTYKFKDLVLELENKARAKVGLDIRVDSRTQTGNLYELHRIVNDPDATAEQKARAKQNLLVEIGIIAMGFAVPSMKPNAIPKPPESVPPQGGLQGAVARGLGEPQIPPARPAILERPDIARFNQGQSIVAERGGLGRVGDIPKPVEPVLPEPVPPSAGTAQPVKPIQTMPEAPVYSKGSRVTWKDKPYTVESVSSDGITIIKKQKGVIHKHLVQPQELTPVSSVQKPKAVTRPIEPVKPAEPAKPKTLTSAVDDMDIKLREVDTASEQWTILQNQMDEIDEIIAKNKGKLTEAQENELAYRRNNAEYYQMQISEELMRNESKNVYSLITEPRNIKQYVANIFRNDKAVPGTQKVLSQKSKQPIGKPLKEYNIETVRDMLMQVEDEPWAFGRPPEEGFSDWLSDILSGGKTINYIDHRGAQRSFGEVIWDSITTDEMMYLKSLLRDNYDDVMARVELSAFDIDNLVHVHPEVLKRPTMPKAEMFTPEEGGFVKPEQQILSKPEQVEVQKFKPAGAGNAKLFDQPDYVPPKQKPSQPLPDDWFGGEKPKQTPKQTKLEQPEPAQSTPVEPFGKTEQLTEPKRDVLTRVEPEPVKKVEGKQAWELSMDKVVWEGSNPQGKNTDRALRGRLAYWERIQKEAAAEGRTIDVVEKAIAEEKARIARATNYRNTVENALSEGKRVPDNVVDEFLSSGGKLPETGLHPELQAKYGKKPTEQPEPIKPEPVKKPEGLKQPSKTAKKEVARTSKLPDDYVKWDDYRAGVEKRYKEAHGKNPSYDEIAKWRANWKAKFGDEKGFINKKALAALSSLSIGVASAIPYIARQREEGGKPAGERTYMKGGILRDIQDVVLTGEYLSASLSKSIARGNIDYFWEDFFRRPEYTEKDWKGIGASIGLDPFTYIPIAGAMKPLIKGLKWASEGIGLSAKYAAAAESFMNAKRIKRITDFLEFEAGAGTVTSATKRVRQVREAAEDKYIIELGGYAKEAGQLAREIIRQGKGIDADIARLTDAGWEFTTRMTSKEGRRQAIEEATKGKGKTYASDMKALYASWLKMDKQKARSVGAIGGDAASSAIKVFSDQRDALTSKYGASVIDDLNKIIEFSQRKYPKRTLELQAKINAAKKAVYDEIAEKNGKAYADKVFEYYKKAQELDAKMGQALVRGGLLEQEVIDAWRGNHLRRLFSRYEDAEAYIEMLKLKDPVKAAELMGELKRLKSFTTTQGRKLDWGAIKARQELSKELTEILEEIPYSSVRLMTGYVEAGELLARSKMYKELAKKFAITPLTAESGAKKFVSEGVNYVRMPSGADTMNVGGQIVEAGKYWGDLAGKYVPEALANDLMNAVPRESKYKWLKQINARAVGLWKTGKVPYSFVTQARNAITNIVLADVIGKNSPWRIDNYYQALKSIITKDEWYQEASKVSTFLQDTFIRHEIRDVMQQAAKDPYSKWQVMSDAIKRFTKAPGEVYQLNEQWFKMAVYINARKAGTEAVEAAKLADTALFNYRKVPPALKSMRRHGIFPFITFTYKAIPALTKEIYKDTGRAAKYAKVLDMIQNMTPKEQREYEEGILPSWMKGQLRLPGKDARYLETQYLNPYGGIDEDSMLSRKALSTLAPLPMTLLEIAFNKKLLTGQPVWGGRDEKQYTTGEKVRQGVEHFAKFALPSLTPRIPAVLPKGGQGFERLAERTTKAGKPIPVGERIAYLFGLKINRPELSEMQLYELLDNKGYIENHIKEVMSIYRRANKKGKLSKEDIRRLKNLRDAKEKYSKRRRRQEQL